MADELDDLARDLGRAAFKVTQNAQKAVEVTARHVKDDAKSNAKRTSGRHAAAYPYSIDYDMFFPLHQIRAEIGPSKQRKQGAFGAILEGGSRTSPAHEDLARAAKSNVADLVRGLAKAAGDFL